MDCLVDQYGYRECNEGSSKVLPCAADGPLESGILYFGICSNDKWLWDYISEGDSSRRVSFDFVRRCRPYFVKYGQEECVGGGSDVCRGACFVTLQDAEVCDSLDYSGGVPGM